jgi:hypothetical protein
MKRFIFVVGFVVAFVVVVVLLWQNAKHSSDAKLARQITGTWTRSIYEVTFLSDGSYTMHFGRSNAMKTWQGTWLVKGGGLVLTCTNAPNHKVGAVVGVDNVNIVHVDEHQFIFEESGDTHTNTR